MSVLRRFCSSLTECPVLAQWTNRASNSTGMGRVQVHVRNKLVAGTLAAVPVVVTLFILWYVDSKTRAIFGVQYPFLGIAIALAAIYLFGLFVTSVIGQFLLGITDA